MASSDRSSVSAELPHPARRNAWRRSLALFACFCVVAAALHTVLQGFDWWFVIAGTVLAVIGTAAVSRALSSRTWLPTLLGSLVLLGYLTVAFARQSALLFAIPTLDSLAIFGDLGQAGALSIASQSVPAVTTAGLNFLLCLGSGALAVVADLLAVTWRRPALAGIPLAVILAVPTIIGVQLADAFIFLLAAVAWLILLRAGDPFPQTSAAFGIGAAVIASALILPVALPHVDESDVRMGGFGGHVASVNPVLTLGEDLRREVPRTILTYSTRSDEPEYLRLVSLQNFGAETWKPDAPVIDPEHDPSAIGAPPGLSARVSVTHDTTWVDVHNLGSPWLPVPFPATSVSGLRGEWFWNADDLTLLSPSGEARGEQYRVESLHVSPTRAQLDAASGTPATSLGSDDSAQRQKYLALPPQLPPVIAATAKSETATATTDFGRALALQAFFRDGNFAYSETAPADNDYDDSGMTALAQFLEARSGYCIHFASAMAVMARTLGIPSRVAIGFLPGEKDGTTVEGRTEYRVTTRNVHSWPELYFEGIGWMRFEPTPGRGVVPQYAETTQPGSPGTPDPADLPSASPTPTPAPSSSARPWEQNAGPFNLDARSSTAWLFWAGGVGVALASLLLVPALARRVQRSVRLRRFERGVSVASTAWREIVCTARDLGMGLSIAATPRDTAATIARAAKLDPAEAKALAWVLELVERQSFAGEPAEPRSLRVARESGVTSDWPHRVRALLRGLRAHAAWRARMVAIVAPVSLWDRRTSASYVNCGD